MNLIINIPDGEYETLKTTGAWNSGLIECVKNGTPLDDVKAEIKEKSFNHYFEYGEYIGEDCRKERIIYSGQVLEILDNIGKGRK